MGTGERVQTMSDADYIRLLEKQTGALLLKIEDLEARLKKREAAYDTLQRSALCHLEACTCRK